MAIKIRKQPIYGKSINENREPGSEEKILHSRRLTPWDSAARTRC